MCSDRGGLVIASYADRRFPKKAVAIWRALGMVGPAGLMRLYLHKAGFHDVAATVLARSDASDPLIAVTACA